jgi:CRISPR-associated protein Csb2
LLVAIDRTSKFAFVEMHQKVARRTAGDFLRHAKMTVRIPKAGDPLTGPGRPWESAVPYQPTRHARRIAELSDAVENDTVDECGRRGPRPRVEMLECSAGANGGGVSARARLHFAVAVEGPILIGRDSHAGGGLFETRSLSALDS